jgi:hypothetical protein
MPYYVIRTRTADKPTVTTMGPFEYADDAATYVRSLRDGGEVLIWTDSSTGVLCRPYSKDEIIQNNNDVVAIRYLA